PICADLVVRNAIGELHPSTCVPNAFTMPYCGLSMVRQIVAAAMTGSTYGTRNNARTTLWPRNGLRMASATITPPAITPTVVNAAYSSVVLSALQNAVEPSAP